jgi:hypothetical protein
MTSYELNCYINMLGISRKKLKLLNKYRIYIFCRHIYFYFFTLFTLYFILFLSIWLVNQPSLFIGRSTALFCLEIKKKKKKNIIYIYINNNKTNKSAKDRFYSESFVLGA